MNFRKKLEEKFRKLLGAFADFELADGTIVQAETLAVNEPIMVVTSEGLIPANGELQMKDNRIVVAQAGIITEIKELTDLGTQKREMSEEEKKKEEMAEEEKREEMATAIVETMAEEFKRLDAKFTKEIISNKAKLAELQKKYDALSVKFSAINGKTTEANPNQDKVEVVETKNSFLERFNELKNLI
jgi:septal ring factor EnvC (AmiA/AmiB activator)